MGLKILILAAHCGCVATACDPSKSPTFDEYCQSSSYPKSLSYSSDCGVWWWHGGSDARLSALQACQNSGRSGCTTYDDNGAKCWTATTTTTTTAAAAAAASPACPAKVQSGDSSVSCDSYCKASAEGGHAFAAGQMMMDDTCRCRYITSGSNCESGYADSYQMDKDLICYYDKCMVSPTCPVKVHSGDSSVSCDSYCKGSAKGGHAFAAGQMMGDACRCRYITSGSKSNCESGYASSYQMGGDVICYYDSCTTAAPPAAMTFLAGISAPKPERVDVAKSKHLGLSLNR